MFLTLNTAIQSFDTILQPYMMYHETNFGYKNNNNNRALTILQSNLSEDNMADDEAPSYHKMLTSSDDTVQRNN